VTLRWPRSLTVRLGLLFALAAALTFAGVGTYLYRSLAVQLEAHDDMDVLARIAQIRHILHETPSVQAIRDNPHRFVDASAGYDGLFLVLKSAQGEVLLQTQANLGALPALPFAPASRLPAHDSVRSWVLPSGLAARTVAAWGALGNPQEQVQIVVARTASDRLALLATYRSEVLAAVWSGALLAALLGYVLVRHGLRQVRAIARQAQSITAQRLDTRLDASAAPQELQMLAQAFNAMLDRLHASFQRLSQFSADLAHDLRTPINNLMVQTQVALSQPRCVDDYQALLASNVEEYERLARMVESMLFLARADHSQIVIDRQVLDTQSELQRIADYFEGIADDSGVRLAVNAGDTVVADAILFRRAVSNLVANAIRYTPRNGLIELAASRRGGAVAVTVTNPGAGIDSAYIPQLFDRFYRADAARSDSASSAGLGLSIVQSIMALHGGQVTVESAVNGLTTFRLVFQK
jgi:two-component system, OmpR family, heavy metal sensor histidine kinase CusS